MVTPQTDVICMTKGSSGRMAAQVFSQGEQDIDAHSGPHVLSKDIKDNIAKLRTEVARWKRDLPIEDYAAALEVALEEHTIGYVINRCVRDSFLRHEPPFKGI